MSEKLCTLRTKGGGGGKYTETSLWTNSAPTSNFAAQAVTLSDSMDNYKYLRVRYRMSTTDANEYSCIFLVNDIKHSSASTNVPQFSVVARTSTTYVRTFYYVSGTSLQMNAAYVMNNTGNVTNVAIPLEILGLNELDHGTVTTIPEVRFSSVNTSGRCFGYIYLDLSKYKSMTYTLVISNASFGSGQYIRVDNNGTSVQEMGKTAGTYTINFDDSWTGDNYRLAVIATPSAAYGYIGITNIIFTLRDS